MIYKVELQYNDSFYSLCIKQNVTTAKVSYFMLN